MNDAHQELRDLITRIVTGDGSQLENLSFSDADWKANAGDRENFHITLRFDDWMEMVRVARNNAGIEPEDDDGEAGH